MGIFDKGMMFFIFFINMLYIIYIKIKMHFQMKMHEKIDYLYPRKVFSSETLKGISKSVSEITFSMVSLMYFLNS